MSIAFVDIQKGAIRSFQLNHPCPWFPGGIVGTKTPEGCVQVPIPVSTCVDAMKALAIADPPGFQIVNDDDKLAVLRHQNLPFIRETRNQLLAMCDWRVMPDSSLTPEKRIEWVAYRKALRDFPENGDVLNPVWPSMPI